MDTTGLKFFDIDGTKQSLNAEFLLVSTFLLCLGTFIEVNDNMIMFGVQYSKGQNLEKKKLIRVFTLTVQNSWFHF